MQNFFAFLLVLIAASEASKVLVLPQRFEGIQSLIRRGSSKAGKDDGKVARVRSPSPPAEVNFSHARSRKAVISGTVVASTPFANSMTPPRLRAEPSQRSPAGLTAPSTRPLQMSQAQVKKEESPPGKLSPYPDNTESRGRVPIKSETPESRRNGAVGHSNVRDMLRRIDTGTPSQRQEAVSARRAGAIQGASQTRSVDAISSMDPAYRSMLLQLRPGQAPSSKREALAALPPHMHRRPSTTGSEPAPSGSHPESQSGSRMPVPSSSLTRQPSAFNSIPPRGSPLSFSENTRDPEPLSSQSNVADIGTDAGTRASLKRGSPDNSYHGGVAPKRQKPGSG